MEYPSVTPTYTLQRLRHGMKKLDSHLRGNDSVAQKLIPIGINCPQEALVDGYVKRCTR